MFTPNIKSFDLITDFSMTINKDLFPRIIDWYKYNAYKYSGITLVEEVSFIKSSSKSVGAKDLADETLDFLNYDHHLNKFVETC